MKNLQKSMTSYSFHGMLKNGEMDVFHFIETCRYRYNLNFADIWNGFFTSYDEDYLKKIKKALDASEITIANLCCDYAHPWHEHPDQLSKNNETALNCLKAAEVLGAKTIRFDLGVWSDEISEEQLEYISGKFREYAKRAGDGGYKVCVENHWGASRRLDIQKTMLKMVDNPNYGLLLHLGNWLEDTLEAKDANDREMAKYAVHTHLAQAYCERASEIIKPLYDAGYKGAWSIEHHSGKNEHENVAFQLAAVERELCKL